MNRYIRTITIISLLTWGTTLSAQRPTLVVPLGHGQDIGTAIISPDGNWILVSDGGMIAQLWNRREQMVVTFDMEEGIRDADFSLDSKLVLLSGENKASLWDINGKLIQDFPHDQYHVNRAAISPNGQSIAMVAGLSEISIWQRSGELLRRFTSSIEIEAISFSPDGKSILVGGGRYISSGNEKNGAELWSLDGELIRDYLGFQDELFSVDFSPDGQSFLTGSYRDSCKLWNLQGELLQTYYAEQGTELACFTPDGKHVFTSGGINSHLFSVEGQLLHTYKDWGSYQTEIFSPDGQEVLLVNLNNELAVLRRDGTIKEHLRNRAASITTVKFSPDQQLILTGSSEGRVRIWNIPGQSIRVTPKTTWINEIAFAPNGQSFLSGGYDRTATLWDLNGQIIRQFPGHKMHVKDVAFSPDGKYVLTAAADSMARLWSSAGSLLKQLKNPASVVHTTFFRPDGKSILSASLAMKALEWSLHGDSLQSFLIESEYITGLTSIGLSGDGKEIIGVAGTGEFQSWDNEGASLWKDSLPNPPTIDIQLAFPQQGRLFFLSGFLAHLDSMMLYPLPGPHEALLPAKGSFSPDSKFLLTSYGNPHLKLWSVADKKELATLYQIDSMDWVVTTPNGLFDASPGAMQLMFYTIPTDRGPEIIALEQLKARYYEPGLLAKLLDLNKEPIRPVNQLDTLDLYPRIHRAEIVDQQLQIQLEERNGGIGRVAVYINGKEVSSDAQPPALGQERARASSLTFDLRPYSRLLLKDPDSTNRISIRAYNQAGWLKSEAYSLPYQLPWARGEENSSSQEWRAQFAPKLYVVSIGTSNYAGEQLDLRYADQDATSMAMALHAAGAALFNTRGDSVQVHCLTTDSTTVDHDQIAWQLPTKSNIQRTFKQIEGQAKAEDILVVYLSGHGVTYGSADQAEFHYLTRGMASQDLSDNYIRSVHTLSGSELTQMINSIPALKQVLIIDACNSGQIVKDMATQSRGISSTQVRALDRMKDRTGTFVISGSAADKVSYEASQYGQGLLTYSLLQGMDIIAAKNNQQVDVMQLLQQARDQVPELAKGIGGIQRPILAFPHNGSSFDIGLVTDLVDIPVASVKPVFIRNYFQEEESFDDAIGLGNAFATFFEQMSDEGAAAEYIYVDVNNFANAYSIKGRYQLEGEKIRVRGALFKGKESQGKFEVSGAVTELAQLVEDIIFEVQWMIEK